MPDSNPFPGTTPNSHFPPPGFPELFHAPAGFFGLASPGLPGPLAPDLLARGTRFSPGLREDKSLPGQRLLAAHRTMSPGLPLPWRPQAQRLARFLLPRCTLPGQAVRRREAMDRRRDG